MPILGTKKPVFLEQVKKRPNIPMDQLVKSCNNFDDLDLIDFKGILPDATYETLLNALREPEEAEAWNTISVTGAASLDDYESLRDLLQAYMNRWPQSPKIADATSKLRNVESQIEILRVKESSTILIKEWNNISSKQWYGKDQLQSLIQEVQNYIGKNPLSPVVEEARQKLDSLQKELTNLVREEEAKKKEEEEKTAWAALNKRDFVALVQYLNTYKDSVHKNEIDELLWNLTLQQVDNNTLKRYINALPEGNHIDEANQSLNLMNEWQDVKHCDDIFRVRGFLVRNTATPLYTEILELYNQLRQKVIEDMRQTPAEYTREKVEKFCYENIFTIDELISEGLLTQQSWDTLRNIDRDLFPNIGDFQRDNANIDAADDSTDIFLFGTPGTGKTCLLMGLTGANGNGYSLNMRTNGGPYASALQQYVQAGLTPGRTFGNFVTSINGVVNEVKKSKGFMGIGANSKTIYHHINLVEMSGEEFALRIADNDEISFSNMGQASTKLLENNNRKVFFIIVDCTKDMIKIEYEAEEPDGYGGTKAVIKKKYLSQLDILNKFVGLFSLQANRSIMNKVDAIHFVVTKADTLGPIDVRGQEAKKLLIQRYQGPVQALKNFCETTKRINLSTDYRPMVFTFSLGTFYLGDIFSFDPTETLKIIETIRMVTPGTAPGGWFDKFRDLIN